MHVIERKVIVSMIVMWMMNKERKKPAIAEGGRQADRQANRLASSIYIPLIHLRSPEN